MNRAFNILLWLLLMPQPRTDKLHGKVIVSDVNQVQIVLTIEPQSTTFRLSGAAPVAVGDFIDFEISQRNTVKVGNVALPITGITMVP